MLSEELVGDVGKGGGAGLMELGQDLVAHLVLVVFASVHTMTTAHEIIEWVDSLGLPNMPENLIEDWEDRWESCL